MESVVKKSLRAPIRKLTSCVTGAKDRRLCPKHRRRQSRGGGGRGGSNRLGKTPPYCSAKPRDPSSVRSYQADLDKERQAVHHVEVDMQQNEVKLNSNRKYAANLKDCWFGALMRNG